MDKSEFWFTFAVGAIGLAVGVMIGSAIQVDLHHKDAIKAGVARYTFDATTGETKFEFIKPGGQR